MAQSWRALKRVPLLHSLKGDLIRCSGWRSRTRGNATLYGEIEATMIRGSASDSAVATLILALNLPGDQSISVHPSLLSLPYLLDRHLSPIRSSGRLIESV